nr:hypothetical protein [Tanacetum cinerariifolium]
MTGNTAYLIDYQDFNGGPVAFGGSKGQITGKGGSGRDQIKLPYDSPLLGGHASDRAEGSLNLEELSVICTNLSNRVLALETIKDAQAKEILTLKARIKKLEKRCQMESVSKQESTSAKPRPKLDDSAGLDANGMNTWKLRKLSMRGVSTAGVTISTTDPEVSVVEPKTSPTTTSIFDDKDITMAQTLIKAKEEKAKENGVC